ncbi:AAA family ATPase [Microbispora amethystogenes]|uniref:ATP-binding protein n=1 Tax=Microbispora amethystogenes TaxID=1427754 RepID=UPI0033F1E276
MRIDRFDLTAFGPFTRRTLDLSAPGVHVIAGPNEAGKSTALRALDQLLYGIDQQSPYDFVHPKPELRLGALLRHPGGTLEMVRTKSRRAPLQKPDGSPLAEADLMSVLGGVERLTFTTVFALNSAELRQGGHALVSGKGDLSQALAASRSGLSLTNALRDIEARIGELYKRAGSRPRINAQLNVLRDARERKRNASLRPEEYLTLQKEVEAAQERLDRLAAELMGARSRQSRLARLSQTLPALLRCRELLVEMESVCAEGVLAPAEAAERLPALRQELREATSRLAGAEGQLDQVQQELAGLVVDNDLLAHADTIENLFQDRRAVQEASRRLGRSSGDSARLREDAESLLQQVHPDATLSDTARYRVSRAVRSRMQDLHDRRKLIDNSLDQSRQALAARRRKLEQAEKKLIELPPAEEIEPLRAALAAVPHDLLNGMSTAEADKERHQQRARQFLRDLKLGTLPVEEAGSVMTPSREQVDAHADTRNELKRDRREIAKKIKTCTKQLRDKHLELASLLLHDPPPTEHDLASARSSRDDLWRRIRDEQGSDGDVAGEFELAMSQADQISDQMRRDAQKVNARLQLELEIAKAEQELAGLTKEQEDLAGQAEGMEAEWARLWEDFTGPVPRTDAAVAILDDARRLRETVDDLGEAGARLAVLHAQAVQHIARLREVLRDPEGSGAMTSLGAENVLAELPNLLEIAQQRLKEQDKAIQDRAAQEERVAVERAELSEAADRVAEHERELIEWETGWQHVLTQAGLPADRDTVGALADLELLKQVADKTAEASKTDRETTQAAARVEQFHTLLRTTAGACGYQVPEDEAERYLLADRLHADALRNSSNAEKRESLLTEQEGLRADAHGYRASAEKAEAELTELVSKAGVESVEELDLAVRRRARHTELESSFSEVSGTIATGGESLHDLMAKAQETDPDQLTAELAELNGRIDGLEAERSEQSTLLGEKKAELRQLDGSALAAQAAEEVETAAASLVEETEEYLRLEIARTILRRHMEEYRNAQQDPVLARAGGLFRELTLCRFSGLELDPEDDSPTVLARSTARGLLRIGQLSEATADQLYLALRLATLERYAEEGRALPFAVDDIFMTFDDQRARAALAVLNEMADRFQMIVFTHHDHLVHLAREAIPPGRVHIHPLPEFVPLQREAAEPTILQAVGERACRTCGAALIYSGRGRPPVQCPDCSGSRR